MNAWELFLQNQEIEIGAAVVQKWLRTLKISHFDAANLYLLAQDPFQITWFEEHIRQKVIKNLINNNNRPIKVHLALAHPSKFPKNKKRKQKPSSHRQTTPTLALTFDTLNPLSLLNHFVSSKQNQLATTLLKDIINSSSHPKTEVNPLYLFGPTGSGKTHLLMGCANAMQKQGCKALFVRAETFTEHVVSAIRASEMNLFRQTYRNVDCLLIDDVHLFSRKNATQEELFHTFNTLHLDNKQIILCANCPPQDLSSIEPRLVSRFEWGIALPLYLPTDIEKREILNKKAEALNFKLPTKICEFILETFSSNIKNACKAIEALILRTHLKKRTFTLTLPMAQHYLKDLIEEEKKVSLTAEKIIEFLVQQFDLRKETILGKGQTRDCLIPRQLAIYLCRTKLKMPFTKIGELFKRDHSTIISSVRRVQKALENKEPAFTEALHQVEKRALSM